MSLPRLINKLLYKYLLLHNFYLAIVFQHFFQFIRRAILYIQKWLDIYHATHSTEYGIDVFTVFNDIIFIQFHLLSPKYSTSRHAKIIIRHSGILKGRKNHPVIGQSELTKYQVASKYLHCSHQLSFS